MEEEEVIIESELSKWYSSQISYPIPKKIRNKFKNHNCFELIYSDKYDAFKFKSTNNPSTNNFVLISLFVEKGYDEPTEFIKAKLSEYYSNKRINEKYFKLDIVDITDIQELIWSIEGDDIHDDCDSFIEYYFK